VGLILPGRARRAIAVLLMTGAAILLSAQAASAHAQLERSDPVAGAVLPVAPRQVTLVFGEPVEPSANSIAVFDDHLHRVPTGPASSTGADGSRLSASLPPGLPRGTYTVTWQVSSSDTHPVSGSFQFSVGAPSTVTGRLSTTPRNDVAGLILGGMRWAGYVGLALGPGLLLVVLGLWPEGLSDRRTRRLLWVGLGVLVASTMGTQLFQGVWASGQPLSAIWSSPGSLNTHSRRLDQLMAVRYFLAFAFVFAITVTVLSRPAPSSPTARGPRGAVRDKGPAQVTTGQRRPWVLLAAAATSAALMATWALAGHSSTGSAPLVAISANLVHLMALSTWLGGLALIAVSLRPAHRADDLAAVLPGFSRLAFACVTLVVLSGTYLAWRQVGSLAALRSTEYGRLLSVKLIAVVALIALGDLARRWVQRHLPSPPRRPSLPPGTAGIVPVGQMTFKPVEYGQPELARLHRGVFAELGIAVLVLALSSALVVVLPARQDYVAPFHKTVTTAALRVDLDVPSPRVGDTILHVTVHTADGRPAPVTAMRGSITMPSAHLGPLTLQPVSKGGASTTGVTDLKVTLPARGVWTLRLTVQTSPVDATALSAALPVS
jgi:copper transport protein